MLLFASSNPNCVADWSTLELALPNSTIQVDITLTPPSLTLWNIPESSFNSDGILVIPYSVKDCKGVSSNEALITLTKVPCISTLSTCPLITEDLCIQNCDDIVTINLEDLIPSPDCCDDNSIDWSTFDILPGAPIPPATAEYNAGTHSITYTANGSTSLADLITWSVSDALGNHSGINYIQIARVCPDPPSCSDDCYYVSQAAVDFPLNVLGNDAGPNLVPSSLTITSIPSHGTAYVSDGDIYYTPFSDYEGEDSFTYEIFDSNGLSCEATVTLTIAEDGPAGDGNNIITCTSDIPIAADISIDGVSSSGEFTFTLTAYNNVSDPLDLNDEIDISIIVSGTEEASATLLVGSNYTTTVKSGTDDNWLTGDNFAQYLNSATLTAATLVTGQDITFNKHAWAWDKGYTNTYEDTVKGGSTVLNAKEITVKIKARSIANSTESAFVTDIVEKVKIFAFEDTSHISGASDDSNNAGFWEPYTGNASPCDPNDCSTCGGGANCGQCYYHCPTTGCEDHLYSWYSHNAPSCSPYTGLKHMIEYKFVGSSAVTGLTTAFTTETDLTTILNALPGDWTAPYKDYDYWTTSTNDYNLWGHQAAYINSTYMLASEPELEYFIIRYKVGSQDGKEAKCTTASHILF